MAAFVEAQLQLHSTPSSASQILLLLRSDLVAKIGKA